MWLSILNNESLLLLAEVLIIVVGSMLLGILLSYLYNGSARSKLVDVTTSLDAEKNNAEELREQIGLLSQSRSQLQSELEDFKIRSDSQSRTIYEQHQYIYSREAEQKNQKATIDELNATIDSYQHRLSIIEAEYEKTKAPGVKPKKQAAAPTLRANYEHVSKLLGRQVTENDLTLISGIGPKTAAVLQSHRIRTWEALAGTPVGELRKYLAEAGGIYKSLDPSHWSKQARMASKGEWRKLRVFQETLRDAE